MGKLDVDNKKRILNFLKLHEVTTISFLAKELNLSRPTIYLHLKTLIKEGYVKREKDKSKKGAPVTININKVKIKKEEKSNLINFLMKLKEKGEGMDFHDFVKESESYSLALYQDLITNKVFLTKKGEQFLNEGKK